MQAAPTRVLWHDAPDGEADDPAAIHAWVCDLDAPVSQTAFVSDEERQRAARLIDADKRHRFLASRVLLRLVLGGVLKMDPRDIAFTLGPHGKPALAAASESQAFAPLHFNLSHSENLLMLAVSFGRELGADVEFVRAGMDITTLAQSHFAPAERAWLDTLPATQRDEGFFRLWTRKEAFIKVTGRGFSQSLVTVDTLATQAGWEFFERAFPFGSRLAQAALVVGNSR